MKNNIFRKILYIISVLSVCITGVGLIWIPSITKWYYLNFTTIEEPRFISTFLFITVIPFLLLLIEVMKLSKSLLNDTYLNINTLKRLKRISIYSLIEFIIYLIAITVIYHNLVFIVVTIATLMVFMITSVIRELIVKGIELKEEIDLTI
ncbi:MAG: DUF2975 domain-containing protein [Clostridium celatum]|nr:DUF2975 domain-containing protein [Clostridium celatum]MDU2122880.1 DUF2975 domain-containing protein [Clostridium celatum]MDU4979085.1 DUF2975 domain-containing protein [Clostridium celatum]